MSADCPRHEELIDLLVALSRPGLTTDALAGPDWPAAGVPDGIQAHLEACPECRREWEEIADLPFLLRRASVLRRGVPMPSGESAAREPGPSSRAGSGGRLASAGLMAGRGPEPTTVAEGDAAFSRLLGTVRRRHRNRVRAAVAATAVAALVALGAILAVGHFPGGGKGTQVAVTSRLGVHLDASLHSKGWGTALSVAASGLPPRALCELRVDGARSTEVAGWWWSAGGTIAAVPVATSLHLPQIDAVELLVNGRVVARAPLRHRV